MDGFFSSFGFVENPFASTNADKEPRLSSYFVSPPYFSSVRGDPQDPRSNVIFAPRGAGKTAQKVMLEDYAESEKENPIFSITYDEFRTFNRSRLSQLGVDWHLTQIIQRLLAGILALVEEGHGSQLTEQEKRTLAYSFKNFLGSLSAAEAEKTFNSVRSALERIGAFKDKHGQNIAAIIAALATKWGFDAPNIKAIEQELKEESLTDIFVRLKNIIIGFGFKSLYILVDRVDEVSDLANDAEASQKFVAPLVNNLHLLETDNVAFKFFLWDRMEDFVTAAGFRPDRVAVYRLNWSPGELEDMLSKRLSAFSDGRIQSLNQLTDGSVDIDLDKLVCLLSIGSPRDVIRLAQRIVDEHTRIVDDGSPLAIGAIEAGIQKFSRERSLELYGAKTDELIKIGMVSFTIGDLASDIFRISNQAARQKIQNYLTLGAIQKSGEIENPGNRPLHQYSLADPRLAFVVLSAYGLKECLSAVCFMCQRCSQLLVREGPEMSCQVCSLEFTAKETDTLLAHALRRPDEPAMI
ncbi:P-loop ATPase, Sll1717 family [Qipengyuania sp. DGS5-3]|uniref:P-loop ATPase, Sll1717 family n=1 Tax=Qipengyuania sp. DGS5-3 TaxID=3349632 RepID=UPI0036D2E528